ncbi:MAG: hypothetical protein U5N86_04430 [Planctomycetota bacterium]|nr:hypothetical protein [Planctomycetota bacterium]
MKRDSKTAGGIFRLLFLLGFAWAAIHQLGCTDGRSSVPTEVSTYKCVVKKGDFSIEPSPFPGGFQTPSVIPRGLVLRTDGKVLISKRNSVEIVEGEISNTVRTPYSRASLFLVGGKVVVIERRELDTEEQKTLDGSHPGWNVGLSHGLGRSSVLDMEKAILLPSTDFSGQKAVFIPTFINRALIWKYDLNQIFQPAIEINRVALTIDIARTTAWRDYMTREPQDSHLQSLPVCHYSEDDQAFLDLNDIKHKNPSLIRCCSRASGFHQDDSL